MSPLLPRRAVSAALAAGLLGGALVGFSFADELSPAPASAAVAAAELDRAPLPAGSDERGLAGVERTALDLAAALDAVPVRADGDESTRYCPREDLRVRWTAPAPGEFAVGGHIDPVGPAPTQATDEVNGLVVCTGASYAYMGFEARWSGGSWTLAAVPALSDEHGLEHEEAAEEPAHEDEQAHEHEQRRAPAPARPAARGFQVPPVAGIDPYAAYDPQRVCDPAAKPGTAALRDLLLRTYPGSRSLGVSRTCSARGTSEHKEGRAFDWGVNKGVAAERAAAEHALAQLLATDSAGHRHALARRLGVMYLIWDRQIWSAYSASRGWRPYGGANAHTDHVHISLSWDGAMGRTSYWSGANATLLQADPELLLAPGSAPVGGSGSSGGGDGGSTKAVRWARDSVERTPAPRPSGERRQQERRDQERAGRAERRASEGREAQDAALAVTPTAAPVGPAPTDVRSEQVVVRPEQAPGKPERAKVAKPGAGRAEVAPAGKLEVKKVARTERGADRPESKKARAKAKKARAKTKKARTTTVEVRPATTQASKSARKQGGGKGRG